MTRLRERMEREKKKIVDYLGRKTVKVADLFLEDIRKLWVETITEKKDTKICIPDRWIDCSGMR